MVLNMYVPEQLAINANVRNPQKMRKTKLFGAKIKNFVLNLVLKFST